MIYIDKGQANNIVLTLTENSTLSNPYYLFVFENEYETDVEPIELHLTDTSTATNRYNLFVLTEGSGTGDDVELVKGQYTYKIYEAAAPPSTVTDTTEIVIEEGRMVTNTDVPTFTTVYD
jgi:hypothetical protein